MATPQTLAARLFGPNISPTGCLVAIQLTDDALELVDASHGQFVTLQSLTLRRIGFDECGIEIAWQHNGTWALHVLEKNDALALTTALPAQLTAGLHQNARGRTRHRAIGWTVLGLILGAPLLALLAFFLLADPIAGWVAQRIPLAQESQLGEISFAQMRPGLTLHDDGPAAQAVRSIGERLTQGSHYHYRFHVIKDDSINAYAIPGGIVVVHSGLIAASKRPEELAGVLAHEVQHVELRHSLKALIKQAGLSALWAVSTGDLGSSVGGQAAHQLANLKFSRDAEQQADTQGFNTLVQRGIDPSGMVDFFRTLSQRESTQAPAWLSTHPDTQARLDSLSQKTYARNPTGFRSLGIAPWPPALD